MTSKEVVLRTIRFETPDRLAFEFPQAYGSDILWANIRPSPDDRYTNGVDEWGSVWRNIGKNALGEVKDYPLKDWAAFDQLKVPVLDTPQRWDSIKGSREKAEDKFLLGMGISLYERIHFIRGLENTWTDIYEHPGELCMLIDLLVDMNLELIKRYSAEGFDGYMLLDDWGLQNRLMIAPQTWRAIWKPRYERVFRAAHQANMATFLHSCGHIVDILDDLIDIGLDVIHMDQQENMGLALLGERFGGRLTFYAPVDIQKTMVYGSPDDIRAYCRDMARLLGRPEGGFIPRWYSDPVGAGHTQEAIHIMCTEFLNISREVYGKP